MTSLDWYREFSFDSVICRIAYCLRKIIVDPSILIDFNKIFL